MKKGCLIALGIPVAFAVGIVFLFWFNIYDVHVRYRLTIEVQDGDQIKTGSSVVEASYGVVPDWLPVGPSTYLSKMVGNAPTVDLGEKGMLFLTFESVSRNSDKIRERNKQFFCAMEDIWCLPFAAYGGPGTGVDTNIQKRAAVLNSLVRKRGPGDVPFAVLPQLGRFRDINNPLSLVTVSPFDLAASFGAGVELKRVILQQTNDPVTPPPENWPQWLKEKGQMSGKLTGWPIN